MSNALDLKGIFPPLPTSFESDDTISPKHIQSNIEKLNVYDLRGYVICGSNGEFVNLTEREKKEVFEASRKAIPKDKLMIAGTGCQSTKETVRLTKAAGEIGADAALVLNPHYYKNLMTPEVLKNHFQTVADASSIPIILYNMPACSGVDMPDTLITELSMHKNIIGIKDSSGNIIKMGKVIGAMSAEFQVLAGSASILFPALSIGAVGGVLSLANIAPQACLDILAYTMKCDIANAQDIQLRMIPVNNAITAQWSVPALKAAMDLLGLYGGPVRPPLISLSETYQRKLKEILSTANLYTS